MKIARPVTLAVDVGATGIKLLRLDARGRPWGAPLRVSTPSPATPRAVLRAIAGALGGLPGYDRVSVGFPGVVERGVARTAANLHPAWIGLDVARRMARLTGKPTRVANDADVQGLSVVKGRGVELVLTLGTGIGSALFVDGLLVPNLELGHHPWRDNRTYEEWLGDPALKRVGVRRWIRRLREAVATLRHAFQCRVLYLGGGNARLLKTRWPAGVEVVDNVAGLLGGIRLWEPGRMERTRS